MFLVLSEKSPWNVPGDQVAPFFGEKKIYRPEPIEIQKCKKSENGPKCRLGGGHQGKRRKINKNQWK